MHSGNTGGRKNWKALPVMLLPEFAPLKGTKSKMADNAATPPGNPKDFS